MIFFRDIRSFRPVYGLTGLLSLWLCGGLLLPLPAMGGSGMALPLNLLAWVIVALMVLWCALTQPRHSGTLPPGTGLLFTGALLWSLPLLWSTHPDWQLNALPGVAGLWGLLVLYLFVLRANLSEADRQCWLLLLVLSALLQSGEALWQMAVYAVRPGGGFQQANALASWLATGLASALVLYFLPTAGPGVRRACRVALVVVPLILVVLQSRTGSLGAALAAAVLLVHCGWRGGRVWVPVGLMLTGIVVGLLWLHTGPILLPGHTPALVSKDGSNYWRWHMLQLTWQMIQQHPVAGNGYGSFEALFGQLASRVPPGLETDSLTHPHNELLYAWMEGGVSALAGLLLMVSAVLRRLWGRDGAAVSSLALLLPLALHINLEYPLYLSVSHGLVLVMLLVICGPGGGPAGEGTDAIPERVNPGLFFLLRGVCVLAATAVLVFMATAVVTQQRLVAVEQQGLMPLALNEPGVLASLPNPYSQQTRLDFDRHVALLLRYNLTRDPALLTRFYDWGMRYLQTHNDPSVYASLLMIARARHSPEAEYLCHAARGRWPASPRFVCTRPGLPDTTGEK